MLNTVRQKHWRKTQLWGLHKTQGGSERLGRGPYPVGNIGKFQLGKQVKQCRLVKSHRGLCPS